MLQPIHYKDIVEDIDEHLKQHYITVFKSRKRQHMINYNLWSNLDQEQKEEIIEFVEKELANSIATQMMKGADRIPVPCLGAFHYSPAKEFRRTNKRKEDETEEEYLEKLFAFILARKYKPRRMRSNENAESFAKNLAKRKKHLL